MPASRVTLELLADTAATHAQQVGLERVIFIGHPMSGPIALRFATRHPALTDGLILLAGAARTFSMPTAIGHGRDLHRGADMRHPDPRTSQGGDH